MYSYFAVVAGTLHAAPGIQKNKKTVNINVKKRSL